MTIEQMRFAQKRLRHHAKKGLRGKKAIEAAANDVKAEFGAGAIDWAALLKFLEVLLPLILKLLSL